MKTLQNSIASRVISTTIQKSTALPATSQVELELTDEQLTALPIFLAARERMNKAVSEAKRAKDKLALPEYQGEQTIAIYAYVGKGRKRRRVGVAEIQCSARVGYPVAPGWTNKLIDKLTPELLKEIL